MSIFNKTVTYSTKWPHQMAQSLQFLRVFHAVIVTFFPLFVQIESQRFIFTKISIKTVLAIADSIELKLQVFSIIEIHINNDIYLWRHWLRQKNVSIAYFVRNKTEEKEIEDQLQLISMEHQCIADVTHLANHYQIRLHPTQYFDQ